MRIIQTYRTSIKLILVGLVCVVAIVVITAQQTNTTVFNGNFSFNGIVNYIANNLGVVPATTNSPGINVVNNTPSTVGTTAQWSPTIMQGGTAWDTDDAVSRSPSCYTVVRPVTGNTVTSNWLVECNSTPFTANGYSQVFAVTNSGSITATGGIYAGSTSTSFIGFSGTNFLWLNSAPTLSSGFGAGAALISGKMPAFRWNVGAASTGGVISGLGTASTGFNCFITNITAAAANRANEHVFMTASTTTTITIQNQLVSTGAAQNFGASDTLAISCTAF